MEKVRELLSEGIDINYRAFDDWTTPLIAASREGHADLVEYLLANGAKPNVANGGGTPLYWAAFFGKFNVAKILINNGAKFQFKEEDARDLVNRVNKFNNVELIMLIEKQIHNETKME